MMKLAGESRYNGLKLAEESKHNSLKLTEESRHNSLKFVMNFLVIFCAAAEAIFMSLFIRDGLIGRVSDLSKIFKAIKFEHFAILPSGTTFLG